MNPILQKEFRTRMRGGRVYGILLGYSLLLTLLMAGTYLQWLSLRANQGMGGRSFFEAGRTLYITLFVAQALLISAITPAITSGGISIEREQRTLEMVALSLLRPSQIVLGKLTAAVAFVTLLLTASLPLVSLSFLLGGLSPGELLGTFVCLVSAAFLFASTGLFWSSLLRSTAAATAATYATVGAYLLLTVIPITAAARAQGTPFRSLNPISAVFFSVGSETFYGTSLPSWLPTVLLQFCLGALILNLAMARLEHYDDRRPAPIRLWATAAWLLLVLSVVGFSVGQSPGPWPSPTSAKWAVATLIALGLGLHLALVPIFSTGERDDLSPIAYLGGLRPHRLLNGDLPSGAALLGVWLLALFLLIAASVTGMGHATKASLIEVLVPGAIVSLCAVAAFIALGHFFSLILTGRWLAITATYVVTLGLVALPILGSAPGAAVEPTPWVNAGYLVPFMGILALAEDLPNWVERARWFAPVPSWLITSVFYAALAMLLGVVNLALLRRRSPRKVASPAD